MSAIVADVPAAVCDPLAVWGDAVWVARVIQREAANQGILGQYAVGFVVLNRVHDSAWPDTVEEVVTQRSQFAYVKDREPGYAYVEIAMAILLGGVADPTGGATHFYNPALADPDWADELVGTVQIGDHLFGR